MLGDGSRSRHPAYASEKLKAASASWQPRSVDANGQVLLTLAAASSSIAGGGKASQERASLAARA